MTISLWFYCSAGGTGGHLRSSPGTQLSKGIFPGNSNRRPCLHVFAAMPPRLGLHTRSLEVSWDGPRKPGCARGHRRHRAVFCLLVFCWTCPLTLPVAHVQSKLAAISHPKRKWPKMLKARKARPASSPEAQGYNSSDVARICGVSLRQLQWWDERSVVSPRQDGHKRIYMAEEVVEISVIAELRRKGFSLQKIRRVLRFLQKDMSGRLSEALAGSADVHLLTDGKTIFLEDAPNRIIDLLKNARQPMFLVCVTDQVRRLTASAERKPARSETASPAGRKARVG